MSIYTPLPRAAATPQIAGRPDNSAPTPYISSPAAPPSPHVDQTQFRLAARAGGWRPIPVDGSKAPVLDGWQVAIATDTAIAGWSRFNEATGIILGRAVFKGMTPRGKPIVEWSTREGDAIGLDLDLDDPADRRIFDALVAFLASIGVAGPVATVGRADGGKSSRIKILFRAAEDFPADVPPAKTVRYAGHLSKASATATGGAARSRAIEMYASGRQFVVSGWNSKAGCPIEIRVNGEVVPFLPPVGALASLTAAQWLALLAFIDRGCDLGLAHSPNERMVPASNTGGAELAPMDVDPASGKVVDGRETAITRAAYAAHGKILDDPRVPLAGLEQEPARRHLATLLAWAIVERDVDLDRPRDGGGSGETHWCFEDVAERVERADRANAAHHLADRRQREATAPNGAAMIGATPEQIVGAILPDLWPVVEKRSDAVLSSVFGVPVRQPTDEEIIASTVEAAKRQGGFITEPRRVVITEGSPPVFADTGTPVTGARKAGAFFTEPMGGEDFRVPGGRSSALYKLMRGIAPRLPRLNDGFAFPAALAVASTVVSQHCAGPNLRSDVGTIPRCFIGLLADTGAGKDAPTRAAADMLEELFPGHYEGDVWKPSPALLNAAGFASQVALVEDLRKRKGRATMLVAPEGSGLFSGAGGNLDRHRVDVDRTILTLWDGPGDVMARASKANGADITSGPTAVGILAASNETLLARSLGSDSAGSGLLARFLWFVNDGDTRKAAAVGSTRVVDGEGRAVHRLDDGGKARRDGLLWESAVQAMSALLDEGKRFHATARREGWWFSPTPFGVLRVDLQTPDVALADRFLVDWCASISRADDKGGDRQTAADLFVRVPQYAMRIATISARCRGKRHIDLADWRFGARIALKSAYAAVALATERLIDTNSRDDFERTTKKILRKVKEHGGFIRHRFLSRGVGTNNFKDALARLIADGVLLPTYRENAPGRPSKEPFGYTIDEQPFLFPDMSPDLLRVLVDPVPELPKPADSELVVIAETVRRFTDTDPRMKSNVAPGAVDYDEDLSPEEIREIEAGRHRLKWSDITEFGAPPPGAVAATPFAPPLISTPFGPIPAAPPPIASTLLPTTRVAPPPLAFKRRDPPPARPAFVNPFPVPPARPAFVNPFAAPPAPPVFVNPFRPAAPVHPNPFRPAPPARPAFINPFVP